jgi:iron complex transport system permease protein
VAALLLAEPLLPTALLAALGPWPVAAAAAVGAAATMALVLALSARLWDSASLLLAGLMIASACGAVISLLQYFSDAVQLKAYSLWGFGGLGGVTWAQNGVLFACVAAGLLASLTLSRPLYATLLGDSAAAALGVPVRGFRMATLAVASLLAGSITAFCGPIAFVGLAVPHLARAIFRRSDPRILQPACMLVGAALLLVCDALSHFPGRDAVLPLNAITSLFGAPAVLYFLLRRAGRRA